jgi:hypothetical protein
MTRLGVDQKDGKRRAVLAPIGDKGDGDVIKRRSDVEHEVAKDNRKIRVRPWPA